MISAAGNTCAAIAANRSIRTAPSAKFGTTTTLDSPPSCSSWEPNRSSSSGVSPVVPTTRCIACAMHQRTWSPTTSGSVKSTATSASACRSASSSSLTSTSTSERPINGPTGAPVRSRSIAATSVTSGSSAIARHTSWPIRPQAPITPTRIIARRIPGAGRRRGRVPAGPRGRTAIRSRSRGLRTDRAR